MWPSSLYLRDGEITATVGSGAGDGGSHIIAGNLIGTDWTGLLPLPNGSVNNSAGIQIVNSSDNRIGTDPH